MADTERSARHDKAEKTSSKESTIAFCYSSEVERLIEVMRTQPSERNTKDDFPDSPTVETPRAFKTVPVVIYGMREMYEDHVGTKIEEILETKNKDQSQTKVRHKDTTIQLPNSKEMFITKQTVNDKTKTDIAADRSKERARVQIKED